MGESRDPGAGVEATAFLYDAPRTRAPARARRADVTLDARLAAFLDGEYRQVVATVELVCGSLATAEDAVQEGLARAWERETRGDTIDNLAAWVTTVSLNLARSQMRRWRTERKVRERIVPLQRDLPDEPGASG